MLCASLTGNNSMRISLIGAGRVATHLAQAFKVKHQIIDIYSRSFDKTEQLAQQVNASACAQIEEMQSDVDLLIIAVSDQSIATVIQELTGHFPNCLIVHTSGSTHLNVLAQYHERVGVFYPLQTFSLERAVDWNATPLFVEAKQHPDLEILQVLAEQFSQRVYCYDSAQRLSLHLAAVFACNFTNYCYDIAKQVVDAEQVDFSLLYPLILETAQKATQNDPMQMQTGPAMRGDQNIMSMHTHMLEHADRQDLSQVYALMSDQILKRHH
ncbi:Rossmann-like and DUF2520 domain-containing protein [Acinetobacter lanii]|uniref:DUF2520 domain-containing protein n=1 Tax=Acinetobacter lanii TaxID=2715163 RepID=A0A6G8S8E5_9GAMM|nr:Rossmann-like and DUF2520 domain-containing protein [Acinetobacter lanii]QIO10341.1 DUF2520 domain-containing protein [Acinetobacter lanii]